jgi:hypothetical protein
MHQRLFTMYAFATLIAERQADLAAQVAGHVSPGTNL